MGSFPTQANNIFQSLHISVCHEQLFVCAIGGGGGWPLSPYGPADPSMVSCGYTMLVIVTRPVGNPVVMEATQLPTPLQYNDTNIRGNANQMVINGVDIDLSGKLCEFNLKFCTLDQQIAGYRVTTVV